MHESAMHELEGEHLPIEMLAQTLIAQRKEPVDFVRAAQCSGENHLEDETHHKADQQNGGHRPIRPARGAHVRTIIQHRN
jgi:hypothetical protein